MLSLGRGKSTNNSRRAIGPGAAVTVNGIRLSFHSFGQFLWIYLKSHVNKDNPQSIPVLNDHIIRLIAEKQKCTQNDVE